ncbi:MAG TPA: hypothetical protein DCQ31_06805 [Bacteroidales bacterium]|nr:hypothetical protein [Bacteroidales bacterium]
MKIDFRLDYFFGPSGKFAGIILVLVGVITLIQYVGIIFILFGLLLLTYSGTEIDIEKRTFRHYNKLFGFYKTGKIHNLNSIHGIKVTQSKTGFVANSRGGRSFNFTQTDFRILLIGYSKTQRVPVAKFKTKEEAIEAAKNLSLQINLPML